MNISSSVRGVVVASLVTAIAACSSSAESGGPTSSSSTSGSGDSPVITESTCLDRCEAKANGCAAPPGFVREACNELCGSAPTRDEIECLETRSCRELERDRGRSCRGGGSSTSSSSGGSSSSSGSLPSRMALGGTCDCGGAEQCTSPCESGLTCLDHFTTQNDDPAFLGYCSQECTGSGPNDTCPSGFTCTSTLWAGVDTGDWCVQN